MHKNAKDNVLQHSEAKLELYKEYLERYLVILGNSPFISKINIFDIFCGTGIYQDGKAGSPIVAYNCIKENKIRMEKLQKKQKPITLVINDGEPSFIKKVKEYLEKQNQQQCFCDLEFYNMSAEEMLENVYVKLSHQEKNERNLVFIDPYGYKEIHKSDLKKLLDNKQTEMILFLPIAFMNRFKEVSLEDFDNPKYEKLRQFIFEFFNEKHPILNNSKIDDIDFIKHIRDALRFDNHFYSTYYYIERSKSTYFSLFFITHNLLGLEKILEAKWNLNEARGEGFNLPREAELFDKLNLEEQKEDKLKELENLLIRFLGNNINISNCELYEFVLLNDFLPKHANIVLEKLQKNNNLQVWDLEKDSNARRKAFYLGYDYYKERNRKVRYNINRK